VIILRVHFINRKQPVLYVLKGDLSGCVAEDKVADSYGAEGVIYNFNFAAPNKVELSNGGVAMIDGSNVLSVSLDGMPSMEEIGSVIGLSTADKKEFSAPLMEFMKEMLKSKMTRPEDSNRSSGSFGNPSSGRSSYNPFGDSFR